MDADTFVTHNEPLCLISDEEALDLALGVVLYPKVLHCDKCKQPCDCDSCERCLGFRCEECEGFGAPNQGSVLGNKFKSNTVSVVVGKTNPQRFDIHKDVLLKHDFFKKLLSFQGKEADTNVITLDDMCDLPMTFSFFVEYLYQGDYTVGDDLNENLKCLVHARVYILAERLYIKDLKDIALSRMVPCLFRCLCDCHTNDSDERIAFRCHACPRNHCYSFSGSPNAFCGDCQEFHCNASFKGRDDDDVETKTLTGPTLCKLIYLLYSYTPNRYPPLEDFSGLEVTVGEQKLEKKDAARDAVSKYVAAEKEHFFQSALFRALLRQFPEFSIDLIEHLRENKEWF